MENGGFVSWDDFCKPGDSCGVTFSPEQQDEIRRLAEQVVKSVAEPTVTMLKECHGRALCKNGKNGWVRVEDALPEERYNPLTQDYSGVICWCKFSGGRDIRVYKFGGGHFWHWSQEMDSHVTHWRYFPEPPTEKGDPDGNEH